MNITLQPLESDGVNRWCLHAELDDLVAATEASIAIAIPIHQTTYNERAFNAEVCGWRVEATEPGELIPAVGRLLRGLSNAARLPTYIFVARRSRRHYPVYTMGDEVVAMVSGGPVFRHVELAKVRDYLTDYLHAVGELGAPHKSDVLHVRGVSGRTLGLVRPLFYLKKRPGRSEDNEFWAPVFPASDEQTIYTYAASGRREVLRAGGAEVLQLRSRVAQALQAAGRLNHDFDLRADRVGDQTWGRIRNTLNPAPILLAAPGAEMPVFHVGNELLAAELRPRENRYSLYLGLDEEDLRDRVAEDLLRRNRLNRAGDLRVHAV